MATFDEFYASLDPDVGIRGKQFEKFVKWYLKTDPTWASQVEEVWLWNEYPKRWGADCGIDLIFTHKNGNTWAVQSKCISPKNYIKKSEIDSFLSESNDSKIDGRLLIASTDGIGKNAIQVLKRQEKQVVCFLLENFRQSDLEFPSSISNLKKTVKKQKFSPREHQISAINDVSERLENRDKGQVLMACGTGKTLTSLWIKEKLEAKQVLVLVPSLSLLSQTLREWNMQARVPFKWICVCSDKSVARENSEEEWLENTSEIAAPVTNDPLEIKHFLDETGYRVVFATYQSSPLIVEAQEYHDTNEFDLVIADEAHRCAGRVSNAFGCVLDDKKIKASKKLFFTATPRVMSSQIKEISIERDLEIASMDDHEIFGEVLYQIKFSEAIEKNLLSDYQVVVIGVDDEIIKQKITRRELLSIENDQIVDAENFAAHIALTKAIKNYKLKKLITFHSRIKGAKDFAENFTNIFRNIPEFNLIKDEISCDYISGNMPAAERNRKLRSLQQIKSNEIKIITNSKCLSEGVDVPTLSGIAFIDPKYSQIDIIQSVGRAIRKSEDKSIGTIIIPIYLSKLTDLKEEILIGKFREIWQIILALKSQDDLLMEEIDNYRISLGEQNNERTEYPCEVLDKIIFDIPEGIGKKFSESLRTILVKNTSDLWMERYGELKKLYKKNKNSKVIKNNTVLSSWATNQRKKFKNKLLSPEKISLLKAINFPFELKEQWEANFKKYKKYFSINNHEPPPSHILNNWMNIQKDLYKSGNLEEERVKKLNNIGFLWFKVSYQWQKSFFEYKKVTSKKYFSKKLPKQLLNWEYEQRREYRYGKIQFERIHILKTINFQFSTISSEWKKSYFKYKKYLIYNQHEPPTFDESHIWAKEQRDNYLRLTDEEKDLLKEIQFKREPLPKRFHSWVDNFCKLKIYMKKYKKFPDPNHPLNNWVEKQKQLMGIDFISDEKIILLKRINFKFETPKFIKKDIKKINVKKMPKTNEVLDDKWLERFNRLKIDFESISTKKTLLKRSFHDIDLFRSQYKENKLSKKQISLLIGINFYWGNLSEEEENKRLLMLSNNKDWEINYKRLEIDILQRKWTKNYPYKNELLLWIKNQVNQYRDGTLSKERIQRLDKLNINWKSPKLL